MGAVLGDILPLALGVAISPVPIIAAILMLFSARAGGTSSGFLIGWILGIIIATGVFTALAGSLTTGGPHPPGRPGPRSCSVSYYCSLVSNSGGAAAVNMPPRSG